MSPFHHSHAAVSSYTIPEQCMVLSIIFCVFEISSCTENGRGGSVHGCDHCVTDMIKVCRFELFADWSNDTKVSDAKEGMREPEKFVRKM
jgi:hypothetical protein